MKLASAAGATDLLLAGLAAHLNHPNTVNREYMYILVYITVSVRICTYLSIYLTRL